MEKRPPEDTIKKHKEWFIKGIIHKLSLGGLQIIVEEESHCHLINGIK